ncbi:MAG: hypothetical protein JKY50_19230 [Oleispira sp.]|nr:hypothetical protein [Oleispira sp.]
MMAYSWLFSCQENSEVVVSWPHGQRWSSANDIPAIEKILACNKSWLKVVLEDGKQQAYTGWVHPDNQCPNQVTTYP